ncbi:hypothetical protein [Savagea faecisuis]|uniref:Uncharacterized protein n=1 Tax=Savagea faecisuis TaxID=1274803 RepID=A0ABW3GU54_9BACL
MKKTQFIILAVVMSLILGACSSSNGMKVGSSGKAERYAEYYGTYEKVSEGELEGNYFEDYEAVPLEDYTGSKTITLKSNVHMSLITVITIAIRESCIVK